MTWTRTWTRWAAAVVAALTLRGVHILIASGSASQVAWLSPRAAHRVDTDRILQQLDTFFANDAATTNASGTVAHC